MSIEANLALKHIAKAHGFAIKRNACFRVIGNGVLQILKFERHRGILHLGVGLQSMYSELLPQWFTSSGCVPQFHVVKFAGMCDVVVVSERGGLTYFEPITPEEQLKILKEKALPIMDRLVTQEALVQQMCDFNTLRMNEILWNDMHKFAPFLKIRNLENAERVLAAVLTQHGMADESNRGRTDLLESYWVRRREEDEKLNGLLSMVQAGDWSVIGTYLDENYKQNCKYAKFCLSR